MRRRTIFQVLVIVSLNYSCGLLGIYNDSVNYDPDYQAQKLNEITTRQEAIKLDSLIARIDSASSTIPNDMDKTILIIETYKYADFLKNYESRFHTPKDDKDMRGRFRRYEKKKQSLIKNPKYEIIYIDKGEYDTLDIEQYKYVLRTSNRTEYDPNTLVITNSGHIYPFVSRLIYYIYNRQDGEVYKEIKDLSILSKVK